MFDMALSDATTRDHAGGESTVEATSRGVNGRSNRLKANPKMCHLVTGTFAAKR
jgi:hypothetical protein